MNSPEIHSEPAQAANFTNRPLRDMRWRTRFIGALMALLMVSLGSFVVLMSQHVAQEQAQETLERALLRQAQDIMKFRNFYAADIMAPAQSHGARVSHDYKDHPGTLPLPATMVIELGHFFNQQEFGSRMAYYSDMPFPWRAADRQLDGFQQNALLALRNNPNQAYIREEQRDGQTVVRLALADRMQEACVNCHNNYPGSPFTQWKVGQVRGVLEVSMPVLATQTTTQSLINLTLGVLTLVAMLGLYLFWRALNTADKHLRTAQQLATKYQESNVALRTEVAQRERMEQGLRESQQDLMEAKIRADSANDLKSQFLANMSHEIRTPMNGVVGMTQLALQSQLDPQQREFISLAHVSAKHLMSVINDILDFSKIEAGHLSLQPIPCNPYDVVVQTARSFQTEAKDKGLAFKIEHAGPLPPNVMLDPVRLRQILTNLIGNAIKFTSKGEVHVCMTAQQHPNTAMVDLNFSVRDTGIGFAPEQATLLFDPFMQGDGSITRSFGGTGLGLAISRNLVMLMGGDIQAQGQLHAGATFSFDIKAPLAPAIDHAGVVDVAGLGFADSSAPVMRQHVLVVEDHAINLKLAGLLLERMGHTHASALNGQEALQMLQEHRFDMLLLDVMMPVLDGMSTLKTLRSLSNKALATIPVIMVTAHAMTGDRERFLAAGANGYVSKPIGFDALKDEIQRLARERAHKNPPK
jgi:signal transduction histidine kinase/ActR/RegA family two-component response regulator